VRRTIVVEIFFIFVQTIYKDKQVPNL